MSLPVVVYLHGLDSSPGALKATQVGDYIAEKAIATDYLRPAIPDQPDKAIPVLNTLMQSLAGRRVCLLGSSMGGFYATWLAEKYDCQAVLINPVVRAHERLHTYLGKQTNPYSGEQYELTTAHIETLQSLYFETVKTAGRYLLLLQMADEVLDARQAQAYYAGCRSVIEPGGNHRFQGFERHLPQVFSWFELE